MPKRYWLVILTYMLMQLSGGVFRPLLITLFPDSILEATIYYAIISFTIGLIIVLILMRPDMEQAQIRKPWNTGEIVLWSILGVFMAYFAQAMAASIEIHLFGIKEGSNNTKLIMEVTRTIPLFAIIPALIAPILEEIVFRKIIFGSLYNRTNFFIAAIISAFIFGIIHGEPEHILIYASMGLVFAFLYVKTKKIIVPIIVHMILNSITVIIHFSLTPEDIERMEQKWNQVQMILIGGL